MNADVLLEHFHRLGDAPDAVPRLRQFVLELAIGGKLAPRTTAWQPTTLGELGEWGSGGTPNKAFQQYYGGDIPWLVIGDLNGGLVTSAETHITQAGLENSSAKMVEPGTVLIAMYGSIGKLGIAGIRCATNQAIAHCVPNERVVARDYLVVVLKSMQAALLSKGQGIAQQNISQKILKAHPLELPPLPEQHRIVAKVDELMALCDRLEAAQQEREQRRTRLTAASWQALTTESDPNAARFALEQLPALTTRPQQIAALRQTILDLAVRGRLVKQDEKDEPAEELLKKIAKEKEVIEGPIELPSSWAWVRIGNILDGDSQNGFSKKPDDAPDGIPILRISAGTVRTDALVAEEEYKLIGGITAKQREQYGLRDGDLLACRFNGNKAAVGRLTLFSNYLGIDPIYPDKLIRLRLDKRLCIPALLRSFGQSTIVRQGVEAYCATTVGNWGISATNLKEVLVPLPPLAEQRRIVTKVDELMRLCDALEAALVRGEAVKGRLLEAVLARSDDQKMRKSENGIPVYPEPSDVVRMAAEP